jgi:hypothetical protein
LNVSWSEVFCSCNEWDVQKTWMPMNEVVGGIYSPQPLPSRWQGLLVMGAPDSLGRHRTATVHCLVRAMLAQPLEFQAVNRWRCLSSSYTGQSGATLDKPVHSDFCALTSVAALFTTVALHSRPLARRESLLCWLTGQSGEL